VRATATSSARSDVAKHFDKSAVDNFALRAPTAYDFGVVIPARTVGLLLVVGCASPMSNLRDDNRRLTKTVTELRTDRRVEERKIRDLQHQLDELHGKLAGAAVEPTIPTLPVEVAGPPVATNPGSARIVGVAEDGTEIVYEGDAALGKPATIDDEPAPRHASRVAAANPPAQDILPATDRIDVTRRVPPISARAAVRSKTRDAPTERGGDAASDYRAAVELVKSGKQADAIAALRAFLVKYPHHDYANNAQYWLGEAFYAQKDFAHALTEFRTVIESYPRGNKVPDALLKVGYCYQALGQHDKARAVLEQVVNLYPKSEPAVLAAKRLETP